MNLHELTHVSVPVSQCHNVDEKFIFTHHPEFDPSDIKTADKKTTVFAVSRDHDLDEELTLDFKPSDINTLMDEGLMLEFTPPDTNAPDINAPDKKTSVFAVSHDHDVDEELILRQFHEEKVDVDAADELDGAQEMLDQDNIAYSLSPGVQPPPMKTINEFMTEPEVLFQRLVDIEVLMKPGENTGDNLKSALLKHVALCVEMNNIQSKMNVINRHGQYFMRKARSGLREILEERLKALNNQWDKLQEQASARQKDLEQLVQEKADNEQLTGEDSSLNALRNNTALLSSLYFNTENEDIKRLLNRLGLFSANDEECEKMQVLEDDYLDYQASFHDLFEWLTATEEVIEKIPTTHCELSQLRDRMKDLKNLCRDVQRQKPTLDELVRRCREFSESLTGKEDDGEDAQGLLDLWRDVMVKAGGKIRDLQNTIRSVLAKDFDFDKKENFTLALKNCETDVKELVQHVEELTPMDVSDDITLELVNYQVLSSEADILTTLLNALQASSQNSSSAAIAELSCLLNTAKTKLESKEMELGQAGAFEEVRKEKGEGEGDIVIEEIPEEVKSPKSPRPKTWPGHTNLSSQITEELTKFDKWLENTEENFECFVGIAIPQTLNEMKLKLKEIQLVTRSLQNKITEMEYAHSYLLPSENNHDTELDESNKHYQHSLSRAKELKNKSDSSITELKDVRFQWELFESRCSEISDWLLRTRSILISSLKEKDEDSVEFVLGKLLKVRELERKLSEKASVMENVLRQGETVLARTEAASVNMKIEQLKEDWANIQGDLSKERERLENVMRLWKEYDRKLEEIYEWLTQILNNLRELRPNKKELDVVQDQLEQIQKYHEEIDNHQNLKDTVDEAFHSLVENIQGDVERLKEKQTKLNVHWQELQTLVSDRFDELVSVESELERVNMTESIEELARCLVVARELDCVPVPGVGSSSLDDVKALVTKCQKLKRDLRSKEDKLDELKRKSKGENMDEKGGIKIKVMKLDEDWKNVVSLLNNKEEFLKTLLNKWIEFQRQLTHLVDTDSWFATREAAMSKYQHISTEKDRTIALEDVKAMKGFLVTQRISVSAFVESARALISEGQFDTREIEEILGDIEERWMDINMKVNDCEEWLCDLNTKHKSCRDTIGSISTFLDEAELILQACSSFDGDLANLKSQKTKLRNLERELNDLRSNVYNLNCILVDLSTVCEENIIYELEQNMRELNERYGNIAEQIVERMMRVDELISTWENFEKDCEEMLAWLEYKNVIIEQSEEEETASLGDELAELKECQDIQDDLSKQQEFLESIRTRGQDLKGKINQSNLYVSPKLAQLTRKFSEFATTLQRKQERIVERTSSWVEFCDKLQKVDELIKTMEISVQVVRNSNTKEQYRAVQKLSLETTQMHPDLEELTEFVEERFVNKTSEQSRNARNEVKDLQRRWEVLNEELITKKRELETVQRQQAKFNEQCRHLNAVLRDTEDKLCTGKDADHLHEQLQNFEVFQNNNEKYNEELLCAQTLAESLDQNASVDPETRAQVERKFNELKNRWGNTTRAIEKHKESIDKRLEKWRAFKDEHKSFVAWLSEFESRPGLKPVASTDISELQNQAEHVEACKKELDSRENEFFLFRGTTEQYLITWSDSVSEAVEREYGEVESRWLRVCECVAANQTTLELTLCDWQEYTTVMEDTMKWLRQTELYLKSCDAKSLPDVQRYFEELKKLGEEVEERRPHLELLTQRGRRLTRMSSYANADHINTQVSVMGGLWTHVCTCLSSKMHNAIDSLHYLRKFNDTFETLSAWLDRLGAIVRQDKELFYSCSPEEQRLKIKGYRKDIEGHESQRSSLNDFTIQLIDKEIGNELVREVMEQRDALNERWEALCIQLGISYKKAEQTKYSLKLLEAQLTQLNKWMNNVEEQLSELTVERSCDPDELRQQLVDLQMSQQEINSRSRDVISVLSLCVRLQTCSFPADHSDTRNLQIARNSFETRWKEIGRQVTQQSRQTEDRIALCREFTDDYNQFTIWLRIFEHKVSFPCHCEDLQELSLEISRLQELKQQVGAKGVLVERLLTRGNYLIDGCTASSARVVKQMIDGVRQRWHDTTRGINESISRFRILSRDFVEFDEERRSVNAWLTEIEVRLIGLDQVEENQKDEDERLQELKTLQYHVNMKHGSLSELTSKVTKLKDCCSISDYRLQQQKVEELKLRYEQALHYSLTLMLDLAVPSPYASPVRLSTRLTTPRGTP